MPRFSKPVERDEHGELIMPGAYGAAPGGIIERRSTFEWDNEGRALVNVDELSVELSDDEEEAGGEREQEMPHDEEAPQPQPQPQPQPDQQAEQCTDSNNSTNSITNETPNQPQEAEEHVIPTELLDATVSTAPPPTLLYKVSTRVRQARSRKSVVLFVALALVSIMAVVWAVYRRDDTFDSSSSNQHNTQHPKDDFGPPSEQLEDRSQLGIQLVIAQIIPANNLKPNWSSPYWEALYWILYEDPLKLTPTNTDDHLLQQRFLMAAFYFATSKPPHQLRKSGVRQSQTSWQYCAPENNKKHINDLCDHPILVKELPTRQYEIQPDSYRWLTNSTECQWAGIRCNQDNRITEIVLSEYGLSGSILPELANLPFLYKLSLPYNPQLMGTIPFQLFTMVHTLELQYNQHSGLLSPNSAATLEEGPYYYVEPTNETTSLEEKNLVDPIGKEMNLYPLEILNLAGNQLTGSIPAELELAFPHLRQASLQENQFTGLLPSATHWPRFEMLRANANQFSGTIPTTLISNSNLRELDLSYNKDLSGTIPSEIGFSNKLLFLKLAQIELTGTIPLELYQCTRLRLLDIQDNLLEGTMATEIGQLKKLRHLYLQNNEFDGTLPNQLSALTNIKEFHINGNGFVGQVPQSFCTMYDDGFPLSYSVEVVADCAPEEDSSTPALECSDGCCSHCCQKSTGACTANPLAVIGYPRAEANEP